MLLKSKKFSADYNYIKIILVALLSICTCLLLAACVKNEKNNTDKSANITNENEIIIDFINVGKGDCMLIQTLTHVYMIDTGYEETADTVVDFLNENKVKAIDGIIITHYDKDHVGGATEIIKNFDVKEIYMPDYVGEGNKYEKFMEKLEKWNKTDLINYVTEDFSVKFDGIKMDIYPAKKSEYLKENDYSIITNITNNEDTFLFAGDAEEDRIDELLGDSMIRADVLKVPYHGHLGLNSIQFMEEVSPQYAVITSDSEAEVSTSIVYELRELGAECYFNCNGNVRCVSEGTGNIKFTQ